MKVAVLGLGEAGSRLAADLVGAGDEVHGFDPVSPPRIEGMTLHENAVAAVEGCELVMAVTAASDAPALLEGVAGALGKGVVYADLCTGSPGLKESLAAAAAETGAWFVDVALMAAVPGRGLATPALASGTGALRFAELVNARGGQVEVVGDRAGTAAARKLLRSVVMKGLAALLIESTEAATRLGEGEWLWGHLADQLGSIDETLMHRFLTGTELHAGRRIEEMEAARELLVELGIPADMTEATIARLRRVAAGGMPEIVTGTGSDRG